MPNDATLNMLDALTEREGFDTAVFCTYGVDLAFFEDAVLPALRKNGCTRVIIFMDGCRYADTIQHWRGSGGSVGHRYHLVPVDMPPYQAFHPKLTLLTGPERGRLLIGSGNLTFTGFGQNHELYSCFDWEDAQPEAGPVFKTAWQFITAVQQQWGHSQLVDEALRRAAYRAHWVNRLDDTPTADLVFRHSLETPLLDQLDAQLQGETVLRITILTPFLDSQAQAIAELQRRWQPDTLRLVLQDSKAVGDADALSRLQEQGVPLTIHRFGGDQTRYLHAKLLLFESDSTAVAVTGSANCTRPALLATPTTSGNVETVIMRRADTPDYFDYLLPASLLPEPVPLSSVSLRSERVDDAADADLAQATARAMVRLLDLTLDGDRLRIRAEQPRPLPSNIVELQLRLDSLPPAYLPLPAPENNAWDTVLIVGSDIIKPQAQPLVASIVGIEADGRVVDVGCNALWIADARAIDHAVRSGRGSGGRAVDYLSEMVLASDTEWQDLFTEITRLVDLDVQRISHSSTVAEQAATATASASLPVPERETRITLATEKNLLVLDEEEQLATAVSREGELQNLFDHLRQRLPGQERQPGGTSTTISVPALGPKRRWTPERRTQTRFVNLLKKYIASLHNRVFMQQIPVNDALLQYAIFQRILWLIYSHHGLEWARFFELQREMLEGFFGAAWDVPPVADPCLQRHLRSAHAASWNDHGVPLYALGMLWRTRLELLREEDDDAGELLAAVRRRVVACLRVVVDWDALRGKIEALSALEEVAMMVDSQPEDMALGLLRMLDDELPEQVEMLARWCGRATFDPHEMKEKRDRRHWYQANFDYRRALFQLHGQLGDGDQQQRLAQELSFWARRADADEETQRWGVRLVALCRAEADDAELASVLFKRAQDLFFEQEYALARPFAEEALALAEQQGNGRVAQNCTRLLNNIQYMDRS